MPEKSHLKQKTPDNLLMATHSKMFCTEIDHLSTATRNLFKALRVQPVDPLKEFRTQTTEIARAIDSIKTLRVQPVDPLKEFRTQTTEIARAIDSIKTLRVQPIDPLKEFRTQTTEIARAIDSIKTLRVQPIDPLKEFRTQTTEIARAIDSIKTLRVQMVQFDKSVINTTRFLDAIAKSTTVLIPTGAVDIDAFIESEHREVVEQLDEIQCPDDLVRSFGKKVFIACGQDKEAKQNVAWSIQKLGLEVIIIDEQPSGALTQIEKLEKYTDDVGFTVALLTPDDVGKPKDEFGKPNFRPSQDVIWELATLICKYGRDRICLLYKGKLELPSYMNGINLVPMDTNDGWILNLIQEMKSAGLLVDMSKVI